MTISNTQDIEQILASSGPLATAERQALVDRLAQIEVETEAALVKPLLVIKKGEAKLVESREELAVAERGLVDAKRDLAAVRRRLHRVPRQPTIH